MVSQSPLLGPEDSFFFYPISRGILLQKCEYIFARSKLLIFYGESQELTAQSCKELSITPQIFAQHDQQQNQHRCGQEEQRLSRHFSPAGTISLN
jgi:hypothetical protein